MTIAPLTKSRFRQYRSCPHECWLQWHDPDRYPDTPDQEIVYQMEQGYAIEQIALDYFENTDNLLVEFQVELESGELYARADIVLTDLINDSGTLVEVKSGTTVSKDYIDDLAFQVIAAESAGKFFDHVGLLYVNKQYIYNGVMDARGALAYAEVTDAVNERLSDIRAKIAETRAFLSGPEPEMPVSGFCSKKSKCTAFQKCYPDASAYSLFQLSGIHQTQLRTLLEMGVTDLRDIPDDFELPDKQKRQIAVARNREPFIDSIQITHSFRELQFPLYFLDYESLHHAVPIFPGTRPYQQVVFQWSLHILEHPDADPVHREFLSDGKNHPMNHFVQSLYEAIPDDNGTVVVWNKDFETRRNTELGVMFPYYSDFMAELNGRVYDLMEIFRKQYFVHPAANGSYSIKRILPVLAPHLSYNDLAVSQGLMASIRWFEMATGKVSAEESSQIMEDLRAYCRMDTLAMVEIYKGVIKSVKS